MNSPDKESGLPVTGATVDLRSLYEAILRGEDPSASDQNEAIGDLGIDWDKLEQRARKRTAIEVLRDWLAYFETNLPMLLCVAVIVAGAVFFPLINYLTSGALRASIRPITIAAFGAATIVLAMASAVALDVLYQRTNRRYATTDTPYFANWGGLAPAFFVLCFLLFSSGVLSNRLANLLGRQSASTREWPTEFSYLVVNSLPSGAVTASATEEPATTSRNLLADAAAEAVSKRFVEAAYKRAVSNLAAESVLSADEVSRQLLNIAPSARALVADESDSGGISELNCTADRENHKIICTVKTHNTAEPTRVRMEMDARTIAGSIAAADRVAASAPVKAPNGALIAPTGRAFHEPSPG